MVTATNDLWFGAKLKPTGSLDILKTQAERAARAVYENIMKASQAGKGIIEVTVKVVSE